MPKEKFNKKSQYYIDKANNHSSKIKFFTKDLKAVPGWARYSKGTKFKDKDGWWIKTDEGMNRKKLDDDDILLKPVMPMFCPKCTKLMKRGNDDYYAYIFTGQCFICHINEHAKQNSELEKKKIQKIKEEEKENK